MPEIHNLQLEPIVDRALQEDWGNGDWTTDLCIPKGLDASAKIVAKQNCVVAGSDIARMVFRRVNEQLDVQVSKIDGERAKPQDVLLEVHGEARSILKAERVALNFFGRMCGIATATRGFVDKLEAYPTQLLDTRKTTPGLRIIEKAATSIGGARNHRLCLTDGVLIKENHIRAAGSISLAVNRLLESLPPTLKIEVETTNFAEVHEALEAGADLIMLDNMSVSEMTLAVRTARGRVLLEASGNVTLDNVEEIAKTGVDFISTSSILHSAPWADLSLLFDPKK
ncbi:MAG: carboxylating nicotinate-nucleotide diphosphorylase [Oligoflexales bacterium]|nr:carboxylating nicotinate-nucleotide diphosphorylase [Oligoflexales bacterium]